VVDLLFKAARTPQVAMRDMWIDSHRIASALTFACVVASATACTRQSTSNTVNTDSTVKTPNPDSQPDSGVVRAQDTMSQKGNPTVAGTKRSATDTARGVVRRYGAEPLTRLGLATGDSATAEVLALSGEQLGELAAAEGLEVMVSGQRTNERAFDVAPGGAVVFKVQWFVVRAADGVEARDGVLIELHGQPFLETAPGVREPIVGLPAVLASAMGARIFLVGPRGSAPHAFGVLRKP